jgi:hypothetical protein
MINPFFFSNRRGVPKVDVQSVTVTDTNVQFLLPNNAFRFLPDNGLVLIRIGVAIPTGTTATLPLVFSSNESTQVITDVGGTELTAADIPSTGVYLFFYDKSANLMQLLSRTT